MPVVGYSLLGDIFEETEFRIEPLRLGSEREKDSLQIDGGKCETDVNLYEVTQAWERLLWKEKGHEADSILLIIV